MNNYKIITAQEAYEKVKNNNLKSIYVDCYPEERGSYSTYLLSEGNYLVAPSNFTKNSPAFIFFNKEIFFECVKAQRFPLPISNMSFYEIYQEKILGFRFEVDCFKEVIRQELGYTGDFKSVNDFQNLFEILFKFIHNSEIVENRKEGAVVSYVMLYLAVSNLSPGISIEFVRKYSVYNIYYVPVIRGAQVFSGNLRFDFENIYPIEQLWISLSEAYSEKSFDTFVSSIGIFIKSKS